MELPREVLVSVDPIVDMTGFARMRGISLRLLEATRREDPAFPQPLGELSYGPVFALGAVRDYFAGPGGDPGDAAIRQAASSGLHDPARIAQLMRHQGIPPIGTQHNPAFVTPVWEECDPDHALAGGRWIAAVFFDNNADDSDPAGETESEPEETYEVLAEVDLVDLMERIDWTMWLQLHIRAMVKAVDEAIPLVAALQDPNATDATRERAVQAAATLMAMTTELASATIQKVREPDCPTRRSPRPSPGHRSTSTLCSFGTVRPAEHIRLRPAEAATRPCHARLRTAVPAGDAHFGHHRILVMTTRGGNQGCLLTRR